MTSNHTNIPDAELEELDRILRQLPGAPPSPQLKNQILSSAKASRPIIVSEQLGVIDAPGNDNEENPSWLFNNWTAGALMAASLLLGVWAGFAEVGDNYLIAPLEIAGIDTSRITDAYDYTGYIPGPQDAL